jgi:hypothetical protein
MMSQADLWKRAAECGKALQEISDPAMRQALKLLQRLWANLANEGPFLPEDMLGDQVDAMNRVHAELVPPTMH